MKIFKELLQSSNGDQRKTSTNSLGKVGQAKSCKKANEDRDLTSFKQVLVAKQG